MSKQLTDTALITVTSVAQQYEAHMLKILLEEEGINVFLQDEVFAQLYAGALGGIKIQVAAADAEKARKLLVESGQTL